MRPDRDTPASTPAERREQLDHALTEQAESGRGVAVLVERGRALAGRRAGWGVGRNTAHERALTRLVRAHRGEYLALLAQESAAVVGGR